MAGGYEQTLKRPPRRGCHKLILVARPRRCMSATRSCVLNHEVRQLHCHRSTRTAVLFEFLTTAAGAGVVTTNLRLAGGRMRERGTSGRGWLGIERQAEILKHRLAPVVYPALEHFRPLAHGVHRHEITLNEVQQVEGGVGDRNIWLAVHLHRSDRRQTT